MKKEILSWCMFVIALLFVANVRAYNFTNISCITAGSDCMYVGCGNAVLRIGKKTGRMEVYHIPQIREKGNAVRAIKDVHGLVWVATTYGLCQLEGDTILQIDDLDYARAINIDANETVWVGGVLPLTKYVENQKTAEYWLHGTETSSMFSINRIRFDSKGQMWLATRGGRIYNDEKKESTYSNLFSFSEEEGYKAFPNLVNDNAEFLGMDIDADDNIWLATNYQSTGPIMYSHAEGFRFFNKDNSNYPAGWNMRDVACSEEGVFLCTDRGLLRYNGEGFDIYPFEVGMSVVCMLFDEGNIYIGTKDLGLWRFRDGLFARVPLDTEAHSVIQSLTKEEKAAQTWTIDGRPATNHAKGVKVEKGRKTVVKDR